MQLMWEPVKVLRQKDDFLWEKVRQLARCLRLREISWMNNKNTLWKLSYLERWETFLQEFGNSRF